MEKTCVFESAHGKVAVEEVIEYKSTELGRPIVTFKGSLIKSGIRQAQTFIAYLDDLIVCTL